MKPPKKTKTDLAKKTKTEPATKARATPSAEKPVTESVLESRRGDSDAKTTLAAYKRANNAFDDADYEAAVAAYDKALTSAPGFIEATYNRATALLLLGRFDEALAGFIETIRLDPEHAMACNNGGVTAIRIGDYPRAAELCRRALALDPTSEDALMNLGTALVHIPDLVGAREVADQLDALAPDAAARLRRRIENPPRADKPRAYASTLDGVPVDESEDPLVNAYNLLAQIEDLESEDEDDPLEIDVNADLVLAAYMGDLVRVKRALDAGASSNTRQKGTGYPVLVLAVSNGHTNVVQTLLEHGADVNAGADVDLGGWTQTVTALMRAEADGNRAIVKLLRQHGAR